MITNFGKILTVVVFTTKLENADNGTDNKINFDLYHFLEMKIRELAQYHWYLVFKLNVSDFMSYKDPSFILREMIKDVYEETGSFENIPDMLFIYHFMYNSNSLNIRNECIHGRDYLSGANLRLAFRVTRVTLLSILMLDRRIKKVGENKNFDAFSLSVNEVKNKRR